MKTHITTLGPAKTVGELLQLLLRLDQNMPADCDFEPVHIRIYEDEKTGTKSAELAGDK